MTGGVPDLVFYALRLVLDGLEAEVYADCCEVGLGELVVRELSQNARLPHAGAPYQD